MTAGRKVAVLLLVAVLTLSGSAGGSYGGGVTSASADRGAAPTPIDSCTTITEGGEYTLVGNVGPADDGPCIDVAGDGVTFDGNGFTVDGTVSVGEDGAFPVSDTVVRNVVAAEIDAPSVRNLTVEAVDAEGGLEGVSFDSVTVRDSRFGGSGVLFHEQGTDLVVSGSTFDGRFGVVIDERVQRARVVDNEFRTTDRAISVSSTSGTTRDVLIARNRIDADGGDGIVTAEGMIDVDVRNNTVTGAESGIEYLAARGEITGNEIRGNDRGIAVVAVEAVEGVYDVLVAENRVTENRVGVSFEPVFDVEPASESSSLQLRHNVIADNAAFGVRTIDTNVRSEAVTDARNNYWGAPSGPSSAPGDDPDAPFADPVTGAPADGDGDAVSEGETPGIANVRFDPFLERAPGDATGDGDGPIGFYQVDFVAGDPIEQFGPPDSDRFYSDQGRLVGFLHGSAAAPVDRVGAPPTLDAGLDDCVTVRELAVEGATATVRFSVAPGCERGLALVSYEKPGAEWSRATAGDQRLVDAATGTFGPGTHVLEVALPTASDGNGD